MFHVTPGSFIGLDVDVVWMWIFVGALTLICGLHIHLLHCVFLLCHAHCGVGGGVGGANDFQCLLSSEVMLCYWYLLLHLPSEVMLCYWSLLLHLPPEVLDATLLIFTFTLVIRSDATPLIINLCFSTCFRRHSMLLIFASTLAIRSVMLPHWTLLRHLPSEVMLRYWSLLRHLPSEVMLPHWTLLRHLPSEVMLRYWSMSQEFAEVGRNQ